MRKILISLRGGRPQSQIADEMGISQQLLSAIETGKRAPSIKTMKKFEKYYGISMVEIFPDIFLKEYTTNRGDKNTA